MTSIIINILDMIKASIQPVFPCRPTPFVISSFHLTHVMSSLIECCYWCRSIPACRPVFMLIMIRQDNHHNHPRHDQSQSKTTIPLPSDTFHDKLFPVHQRDVLINSIVLLVQVVPRFWHSSGSCRRNTFDAPLRSLA